MFEGGSICRLKRFLNVLREQNVSLQTFWKVIVVSQGNFLFKLLCEERREMTIKAFLSISFPQSVAYCWKRYLCVLIIILYIFLFTFFQRDRSHSVQLPRVSCFPAVSIYWSRSSSTRGRYWWVSNHKTNGKWSELEKKVPVVSVMRKN